jgi:hypothetical protein
MAKRCAERAQTIKSKRMFWYAGFGSHGHETTEGVFGLSPVLPSRAIRSEVLRLSGQSSVTFSQGKEHGKRIGRHRGRIGRVWE